MEYGCKTSWSRQQAHSIDAWITAPLCSVFVECIPSPCEAYTHPTLSRTNTEQTGQGIDRDCILCSAAPSLSSLLAKYTQPPTAAAEEATASGPFPTVNQSLPSNIATMYWPVNKLSNCKHPPVFRSQPATRAFDPGLMWLCHRCCTIFDSDDYWTLESFFLVGNGRGYPGRSREVVVKEPNRILACIH